METYQLVIDGEEVVFSIEYSGQAMAGVEIKTDASKPMLRATIWRDGREVWGAIVSDDVTDAAPIHEQFSDEELERLYRAKRTT